MGQPGLGGVDVFLLISGFLITGQLYRAACGSGIDLGRTWARMVKRLFSAVLTVLAGIVLLSVILLPETRWNVTIRQILAAARYLENWQLIGDQADYFTDTSSSSVVQHFWSLSIQGQFSVTWPFFVGAVTLAARRTGRSLQGALILALSSALALSLAFSIVLTFRDQPTAYFHSLTRVCEFALGGLLALLIDRIHLGPALRAVPGLGRRTRPRACGAVLSVGQAFPGYAALWPTGCAVAVIVAGSTGSRWSSGTLLSSRSAAYLGRLSFSLYLWHWPILVLYLSASGHAEAGLIDGARSSWLGDPVDAHAAADRGSGADVELGPPLPLALEPSRVGRDHRHGSGSGHYSGDPRGARGPDREHSPGLRRSVVPAGPARDPGACRPRHRTGSC